jgi:DNA-binding XRE family transcriptional regulator
VTDRQILRHIGQNVKAARLRAGLTQECLAELASIHWQTVSYVENGKFMFSIVTFVKISHALEVSPNRLLEGIPEPETKRMERIKKIMARKRQPRRF